MTTDDEAVALIRDWYATEPDRYRSRIGIPNAGLHLLERFRTHWPLKETHYLTPGGGQVSGLGGASGDLIVARFVTTARSLGSEAGRTSRSTPVAARRLAERLNQIDEVDGHDSARRAHIADAMQAWLVTNVLLKELVRSSLPRLSVGNGLVGVQQIEELTDLLAGQINDWKRAATSVVTAACEVAIPGMLEAATPLDKKDTAPDLRIMDAALIIADIATPWVFARCRSALSSDLFCILIVPQRRLLGACQLAESEGLARSVDVESAGTFVTGLIRQAAGFEQSVIRRLMAQLLPKINELIR